MTNSIALQAAAVTMLLAKRPRLSQLPIDWSLRDNGDVSLDLALDAPSHFVPEIVQELAKALRGPVTEVTDERKSAAGRRYRMHTVHGKHAGIRVYLNAFEYFDEPNEGGEAA